MINGIREHRPECPHPSHDTDMAYTGGCRCPKAREAHRIYRKRIRQGRHVSRRLPVVGVRRRIRALSAIGWALQAQTDYLGLSSKGDICKFLRASYVHQATFDRVDAMYRALCMTPGPSLQSRRMAAQKGWPPPLAWDDIDDPAEKPALARPDSIIPRDRLDSVVVDLAVAGRRPTMSPTEVTAAVERLIARGFSGANMAERLGVSRRSVERVRARLGSAAADELADAS